MKYILFEKHTNIRFLFYFIIAFFYIFFMSLYAPLGTNWLDWHFQRIYNFSEYLKINGYFSNFGFSIWHKCIDCSLEVKNWEDRIYLSINFFSLFPYVLINDLFGSDSLKVYGNLLDKIVIIGAGCLIAEIYIKTIKKKNHLHNLCFSLLIFSLFIINPWTYKMLIGSWWIIYFVFFFLFGILMILSDKKRLGLFSFLLAGFFDYQSSIGIVLFYILLKIFYILSKKKTKIKEFFPLNIENFNNKILIYLSFPTIVFVISRFMISLDNVNFSGSSFLTRIGISGDDIYNGGILGAFQFLGGNRITLCLADFSNNLSLIDLNTKIKIFNCSLSILSMFLVSLLSIWGIFILYKNSLKFFNLIIFPLLFLLLSYTLLLQQSSSVHLMGYSYLFSIIFSIGLSALAFNTLKKNNYSITSTIFFVPIIIGVFILCIRVSMLTGLNG